MFAIAGLAIAFVWGSIWFRFRDFEPPPPPEPSALRAWDFLGCWRLQVDAWADPTTEMASPSESESPTGPRVTTETVSTERHLMLLPDSVDEWGRMHPSYRAVTLTPGIERDDVSVRWFTRADTLWFVWSDAQAQGGAALRDRGDRLLGRAVAELHGSGGSLEAPATAWEVNCHSLRPDRIGWVNR